MCHIMSTMTVYVVASLNVRRRNVIRVSLTYVYAEYAVFHLFVITSLVLDVQEPIATHFKAHAISK